MINTILPSPYKKDILIEYITSFYHASLLRYNYVDFSNLYIYNAPIYLKDILDFNFTNIKSQMLFESLFVEKSMTANLDYLFDIKMVDLKIASSDCYHYYSLFEFNNRHFIISYADNKPDYKNLWLVLPRYSDDSYIAECENDLSEFLQIIYSLIV